MLARRGSCQPTTLDIRHHSLSADTPERRVSPDNKDRRRDAHHEKGCSLGIDLRQLMSGGSRGIPLFVASLLLAASPGTFWRTRHWPKHKTFLHQQGSCR